jgi:hypothetical protein
LLSGKTGTEYKIENMKLLISYRYRRFPLLLVQVNKDNGRIRIFDVYELRHLIMYSEAKFLTELLIADTNLDGTKYYLIIEYSVG